MMQRFLMTRRSMLFSLIGMLVTALLAIYGCGGSGSGSYTDPNSLITTTKASAVISAAQLKTWINEGKLNAPFGSKDRIVIVSPATATEWVSPEKGHIPGAVRWDLAKLAEDGRTEGLSISGSMMPSGAMMDGIIQDLGIDGNTTIVISLPKNGTLYYQSLIYWDLRYWGFPKERIKILSAGDDAWEVANNTLSIDATEKYAKSTYSVAYNAGIKPVVRYNIGQMIAKIDETIANSATLNDWQIIDVRSYTQSPYVTNALRMSGYTQFFKRLVGPNDPAGIIRNFEWPDKTTLEARMADITNYPVKNGTTNVTLSATKKTIVMCTASSSASPTFVLFDAVLAVPEGNIAMYDGSANQWTGYTADQLAYKLLGGTSTAQKYYKDLTTQTQKDQILQWAFNNPDDPTKNRAQGISVITTNPTTPPALPTGFSWVAPSFVNGPSVTGMTDQIDRGNQAYIEFIKLNSTTNQNSGSGGSQQGC